MATHSIGNINFESYHLFYQSWIVNEAKAIIVISHGMGEHSNRYAHVAEMFNQNGFSVYAMDHIGHGKSDGKRGHAPSFEVLMNEIDEFLCFVETHNEQRLPVFLYGHSMGGNLAVNYVLRKKNHLKGLILTSPWLRLPVAPPKFQLMLAKLMIKIKPDFQDRTRLNAGLISRDKNEVEKYKNDSLVHDYITPAFFFNVTQAGEYALRHAAQINIPVFLAHGTNDGLTSYAASEEFSKNAAEVKLKFLAFNDAYHELHNDWVKQELFDAEVSWINQNLTN